MFKPVSRLNGCYRLATLPYSQRATLKETTDVARSSSVLYVKLTTESAIHTTNHFTIPAWSLLPLTLP
jgi:hypothetical protein